MMAIVLARSPLACIRRARSAFDVSSALGRPIARGHMRTVLFVLLRWVPRTMGMKGGGGHRSLK